MPKDYFAEEIGSPSTDKDYFSEEIGNTSTPQPNIARTMSNGMINGSALAGGLGALGLAGYGATKGVQSFIQPRVDLRNIEQQMRGMAQNAPEGIEITKFGKDFNYSAPKANAIDAIKNIQTKARNSVAEVGRNIADFDNSVLKSNVGSWIDSVKGNFGDWKTSAYNAYGTGLDAAQEMLGDKAKEFTRSNFAEGVLKKTMDALEKSGKTEEQIKPLKDLYDDFKNNTPADEITMRQANKYVTDLSEESPDISRALRRNYQTHIENMSPEDASKYLKELNSRYGDFAEIRDTLQPMVKEGTVDESKLYKVATDYAKKKIDTKIGEISKYMAENDKMSKKIPEVGKSFSSLSEAANQREAMLRLQGEIKANAARSIDEVTAWLNKYKDMMLQREPLLAKWASRKGIMKGLGKAGLYAAGVGEIGRHFIRGMAMGIPEQKALDIGMEAATGMPANRYIETQILGNPMSNEEKFRVWQQNVA